MQRKPRQLVLDNHDSFTYNLLESCRSPGKYKVQVLTPQAWSAHANFNMDKVIISPGPGLPRESEGLFQSIELLWSNVPLLGVCLGLQAIVEYRGGAIERSDQPYHGMESLLNILDTGDILYHGIRMPCKVGRYHSWRINKDQLPEEFKITGTDEKGAIMSIRHRKLPIFGVQFHPESYISDQGERIIHNFLEL